MSFIQRMLSSVGIGAASVDTILSTDTFTQGEMMNGTVIVRGGNVEQKIDEIYLSVKTIYKSKSDDVKSTGDLAKYKLATGFVIGPNETKELPFSFRLPYHTPITTMGRTRIWLETGLDIKSALDPSDQDSIRVAPSRLLQALLQATEQLGFRIRQVEVEAAPYHMSGVSPIVQQFEYVPYSGEFRGKLDEFEIVPIVEEHQVTVFMEIDRRARDLGGLFAEMLDVDETRVRLTYTEQDLPNLSHMLYQQLSQYS